VRNLLRQILGRLRPGVVPSPAGSKASPGVPDLTGDRDLEWSFAASRIERYAGKSSSVLDFGCGEGLLSLTAAGVGARVLAIDLLPRRFPVACPNIEFRRMDVMDLDERDERFDLVLNCSTIEHVGLAGRYDVRKDDPDGDLAAMEKLRRLLERDGRMLLTLPVGQDAVVRRLHRIYGAERLPKVLRGYDVEEAVFFRKTAGNVWTACSREEAMGEPGGERYYALGLMVLSPAAED
jgi:SAM-dependent methyltransferase